MAEKVTMGNCELWHGDCREVLPLLPHVALVLTDPPYGIGILDAKPARPAWKRGGKKEVLATDETLSDPLRIPLSDLLGRPPEHLIAECAKYLKDGETPVQRIERERRDTDAALTLLIREKARTKALEELLCSAHCIALRHGADTAWDTFAASIRALGIGAVTARVYKVPRDELA